MPKMHLRQPGFTYSAYGCLTSGKERIQKFKETGDSRYIYQNELNKACFQHDMTYGDFKGLPREATADRILHNKAFNITKNPKYDGYQRGLALMVYKFFDKKNSGAAVKNEMSNQELAEENYINHVLENMKNTKYTFLLKTIYGVLIQQIFN